MDAELLSLHFTISYYHQIGTPAAWITKYALIFTTYLHPTIFATEMARLDVGHCVKITSRAHI